MDLNKLSLGLAALKDGLDELDRQCTAEAGACMALCQAANASQQQRAGLIKQVAATQAQVFTAQDESDDLQALLDCLKRQHAAAEGERKQLQDKVAELDVEVVRFVDGFEAQCDAFSTEFGPSQLHQQQADIEAEAVAGEARVCAARQAYKAARRMLLAQQAAVKELRQDAADRHAALVHLKQQVAAESAKASTLAAQLLEAQRHGAAARQLTQLQASVAERETGVLHQQCSIARQEVELGRLQMEVKHSQQDVARKTARLEELNRTVQALGLTPMATSAHAPCGLPPATAAQQRPVAAPRKQQYVVEEPPTDDDDDEAPHGASHASGHWSRPHGPGGEGRGPMPQPRAQPEPEPQPQPPACSVPPPQAAAGPAGSSARGRCVVMKETMVMHSVHQGAEPTASQAQVLETCHVVVQQQLLDGSGGGGGRAAADGRVDGTKRHRVIVQSHTRLTTTTMAHQGCSSAQQRPPPPRQSSCRPQDLQLGPDSSRTSSMARPLLPTPAVQPPPPVGCGGGTQLAAKGGSNSRSRTAAGKTKSAAASLQLRRRKSTTTTQKPLAAATFSTDDDIFGKGENY